MSSAHHTVTEVLAVCGQAEDALEKHTLALIRVYAKTYNYGTELALGIMRFFLRKLHKLH